MMQEMQSKTANAKTATATSASAAAAKGSDIKKDIGLKKGVSDKKEGPIRCVCVLVCV